ncbi:DUF1761 domain-containing protein [Algimonas arctica]|nr:DUF1761 domain-containing protein [Algimonas arctica]
MPKIFNTSWIAVIVATVAFFMFGWLWYGMLFEEAWLAAEGITQEIAETRMADTGMGQWLFFALLITFGQAVGLLMVLHLAGAKRIATCLTYAFWLVVTIVGPVLAYQCVYSGYSLSGFLLDFGHMLIGYLIMAAIYAAFRGRTAN